MCASLTYEPWTTRNKIDFLYCGTSFLFQEEKKSASGVIKLKLA